MDMWLVQFSLLGSQISLFSHDSQNAQVSMKSQVSQDCQVTQVFKLVELIRSIQWIINTEGNQFKGVESMCFQADSDVLVKSQVVIEIITITARTQFFGTKKMKYILKAFAFRGTNYFEFQSPTTLNVFPNSPTVRFSNLLVDWFLLHNLQEQEFQAIQANGREN